MKVTSKRAALLLLLVLLWGSFALPSWGAVIPDGAAVPRENGAPPLPGSSDSSKGRPDKAPVGTPVVESSVAPDSTLPGPSGQGPNGKPGPKVSPSSAAPATPPAPNVSKSPEGAVGPDLVGPNQRPIPWFAYILLALILGFVVLSRLFKSAD